MRTLLVFGLGAAAMYFLDPKHGPRRRARVRSVLARGRPEALVTSKNLERGPFEKGETGFEEPVRAPMRAPF
jgi:hypothetical protein